MRKLLTIVVILMLVTLAGCASQQGAQDDGYQLGDITSTALHRQAEYCAETDVVRRAVLLALLRTQVPDYPASGLCTDPLLISEKVVNESGTISDVDIERAMKDQQEARERQETLSQ